MKNYIVNYLLFVLLILPAIWSFTPIIYGNNAQILISGPELKQGNHFYKNKDLSSLITYLEENREEVDYLAAIPSAMNRGSELILESGEPVMISGGFSGGDNVLTVDKFEDIVKKGIVKYAIINFDNHRMGNNSITEWIQNNGTNVSDELENGAIDGMSLYKFN